MSWENTIYLSQLALVIWILVIQTQGLCRYEEEKTAFADLTMSAPPMALPPARFIFHDKGKCAPTSGLMHVNFTLDSCIACSWTSYQSLLKWPLLGKEKVFPPLSTEQHHLPPPTPEWSCVFALEWAPSVMLALQIVYLWPITGVQTLWQRNLNLLVTAVSPAPRRVLGISSMLDYTDQMNKQIKTVFFWESYNVQCMKGLEKLLSCLKSNHI